MELKMYLLVLMRKWWIVAIVFVITVTASIIFVYRQTPVYSATSTYVVVPSSSLRNERDFASGMDILGRQVEIAGTFAEIANSRRIKDLAISSASIESGDDYSINCIIIAGTNIMEITVEGANPGVVQYLANEVGRLTEVFVSGNYGAFTIVPLDDATIPRTPIKPRVQLILALSIVLGLVLGALLAYFAYYLETPADLPIRSGEEGSDSISEQKV